MKQKFTRQLQELRARLDRKVAQVGTGVFLASASAVSLAQDTSGGFDTADSLLKIAAGLAAGLGISVAMTGAIIAMKASKLPRKGA